MDPFIQNALILVGMILLVAPPMIWLLPKLDRALGRLSDYLDARKAR